jgi:hypothetical protein
MSNVVGLLSREDLIEELDILRGFLGRHGFEYTDVRLGVVDGKYQLLSGDDASALPQCSGYWSENNPLTAEDSEEMISMLADDLRSQVMDSHAMQVSNWGTAQGSGVVTVSRDIAQKLRMAN